MKIYNTLKRDKVTLDKAEGDEIKMYVCGPTVYDVPHIGHVRSAYAFDVIRKYLEYKKFKVTFVRNVTDVDDKIINRAAGELLKEGKEAVGETLKAKVLEVSSKYLKEYHDVMDKFGIKAPDQEPKATEYIDKMQKFIQVLIDKNMAYASGGDVYFSVDKFPEYGKLSGQNKDQMMQGVRIDVNEKKKAPLDFALWKSVKPGEPSWPSPWGAGRPGWHIECSVMSTDKLGETFDIHGGGLDLIFPHHENEVAQAEAATGRPFANCWIHNGLLTVNGEKMSKSLGNYMTIGDYLDKYKDPDLLKIMFLMSHYRSAVDFTDEKIKEAAILKSKILNFLYRINKLRNESDATSSEDAKLQYAAFKEAMDDDFNTPEALSAIMVQINLGNIFIAKEDVVKANAVGTWVKECVVKIFGLNLEEKTVEDDGLKEKIGELIEKRNAARKSKDFATADSVRKQLTEMGIVIEDTLKGTTWRKA